MHIKPLRCQPCAMFTVQDSFWVRATTKGALSSSLQEQIDELVENKILEALCGSEITEVVKVSFHSADSFSSTCAGAQTQQDLS